MTKAEEILNEYGCPEIPFDENVTMFYPSILSAMQEYGKYCAEKLYYTINLDPFEKWWLEFQEKEEETK